MVAIIAAPGTTGRNRISVMVGVALLALALCIALFGASSGGAGAVGNGGAAAASEVTLHVNMPGENPCLGPGPGRRVAFWILVLRSGQARTPNYIELLCGRRKFEAFKHIFDRHRPPSVRTLLACITGVLRNAGPTEQLNTTGELDSYIFTWPYGPAGAEASVVVSVSGRIITAFAGTSTQRDWIGCRTAAETGG